MSKRTEQTRMVQDPTDQHNNRKERNKNKTKIRNKRTELNTESINTAGLLKNVP